jgi:hypothetical protein
VLSKFGREGLAGFVLYVSQYNKYGRVWQVVLQAEPEFRQSPDDLSRVFVRNAQNSALVWDSHSNSPMSALSPDAAPKLMGRFKMPDGRRGVTAFTLIAERFIDADGELVDERRVVRGEFPRVSALRAADEFDVGPFDAFHRPAGQFAEPDLRPGEIGEHADRPLCRLRHAADSVERLLVLLYGAVGHVESEDIDASLDQAADRVLGPRGGAHRGDDLRADDAGG